ncbi:GMC oxidoreductase [Primorskyibacter sp. S187A]|uniref:GMC oxidoreductase n=1 Tax=Primorskyibacter sp. S187A TaxID=3415130 RepID=UPI003C7D42D0
MIQKSARIAAGDAIETDICIIGAGPAGVTLALALRGSGKRILLLEAGGLKRAGKTAQSLYEGQSENLAFHQLPDSDRTRGLGGTSSMWGGRCMPYDEIDFALRPHMHGSGWPISFETLLPFYGRAQKAVDCGDWAYTAPQAHLPGTMIEGAQTDDLRLDTLERWSPPTHFGKSNRAALEAAQDITVLTDVVVTELVYAGEQITRAEAVVLRGGAGFSVRAGQFVLAGGGLETARLLMHSKAANGQKLGDHSGWLGRGYMCHVGGVIARLVLKPGHEVIFGYEQDGDGVYVRRRLTLSAQAQWRHGLPNMYALLDRPLLDDASHQSAILSLTYLAKRVLQRQTTDASARDGGAFAHYKRHIRNLVFGAPEVLTVLPRFGRNRFLQGRRIPSLLTKPDSSDFYLYFHAEQSAVKASAVYLGEERDALGMRRLHIDAKLDGEDAAGIVRAHDVIGQELEKTGAGRLEYLGQDPEALVRACKCTLGHHIGTTRMAALPEDGVVDADARVFHTRNLFVASASILPTSSQAHPTLTVLALALRLADHLKATA